MENERENMEVFGKSWNAGNSTAINAGKNTNGKQRISIYLSTDTVKNLNIIPGDILDLGLIRKVGHEKPNANRFKKPGNSSYSTPKETEEPKQQEHKKPLSNTDQNATQITQGSEYPAASPAEPDITQHEIAFLEQYKNSQDAQKPILKTKAEQQFGKIRVEYLLKAGVV